MNTRQLREPSNTINVVVCYDTPDAGQYFKLLLDRLIQQLGGQVTFNVRLWRFDVLEDTQGYDQALADVDGAPILAIVYTGAGPIKRGMIDLVDYWSWMQRLDNAALVILQASENSNHTIHEYVKQISERNGIDLICSGDGDAFDSHEARPVEEIYA